jgi:hypothetical protein
MNNARANLYIGTVAAAGAAVLGLSLYNVSRAAFDARILAWSALACLTLLVGEISVRLPLPNCKVSFSDAFIFLSLLVFGPDLATVTGALDGCAASTRRAGTWHKRVFNTAAMAISVNLSARLFRLMLPEGAMAADGRFTPADLLVPMLLLATAQYFLNTLLVSGAIALKEGVSLVAIWQSSFPWAGTGYLVGSAAAALVFVAVHELGMGSFVAILPFPAILYFTYRTRLDRLVVGKVPVRD